MSVAVYVFKNLHDAIETDGQILSSRVMLVMLVASILPDTVRLH